MWGFVSAEGYDAARRERREDVALALSTKNIQIDPTIYILKEKNNRPPSA